AGYNDGNFHGQRVTQQESRRRRSKRRENPAAGYRSTRSKRCITQAHAVTRATIRVFPPFPSIDPGRRAITPCSREDSNLHGLPHTVLSRTRLPVPPRELKKLAQGS